MQGKNDYPFSFCVSELALARLFRAAADPSWSSPFFSAFPPVKRDTGPEKQKSIHESGRPSFPFRHTRTLRTLGFFCKRKITFNANSKHLRTRYHRHFFGKSLWKSTGYNARSSGRCLTCVIIRWHLGPKSPHSHTKSSYQTISMISFSSPSSSLCTHTVCRVTVPAQLTESGQQNARRRYF